MVKEVLVSCRKAQFRLTSVEQLGQTLFVRDPKIVLFSMATVKYTCIWAFH